MSTFTEFDVIIIRAGQASVPLAQALSEGDTRVAIAERGEQRNFHITGR